LFVLAARGFTGRDGSPIHADQRFGPHAREAVEAFQQAHGLRADGATLAALSEAAGNQQQVQAQQQVQQQAPEPVQPAAPLMVR